MNNELTLATIKVMLACAWADGEVQPEELECLKSFFIENETLDLPTWKKLQTYIHIPIDEEERAELLEDLRRVIRSEEDRQHVFDTLETVFHADGVVTSQEEAFIQEIRVFLNKNK